MIVRFDHAQMNWMCYSLCNMHCFLKE